MRHRWQPLLHLYCHRDDDWRWLASGGRSVALFRPNRSGAVIGIDFAAAFTISQALDHDATALAELLSAGEAGMVNAINERLKRDRA